MKFFKAPKNKRLVKVYLDKFKIKEKRIFYGVGWKKNTYY